jgi:hypothetical protein
MIKNVEYCEETYYEVLHFHVYNRIEMQNTYIGNNGNQDIKTDSQILIYHNSKEYYKVIFCINVQSLIAQTLVNE